MVWIALILILFFLLVPPVYWVQTAFCIVFFAVCLFVLVGGTWELIHYFTH